jgi:hypothetical protein
MSISNSNHEGWYETVHVADGVLRAVPGRLAAAVGLALCISPFVLAFPTEPGDIAEGVLLALVLAAGAAKFLAEASRARRIRSSLHIASGELEVRAGRGILRSTRAFGAVEVDRFLLTRTVGVEPPLFSVAVVPRPGIPVPIVAGDPDEAKVRDVAVTLSRGMDVPLEDRRYDVSLRPEGAGPQAPARVAVFEEGRRTVFSWSYRDRLAPNLSLLALGFLAFLTFGLPRVVTPSVPVILALSALMLLTALGLLAHVVRTLTVRRVTLRPDAARVERFLAGVPLLTRLAIFAEMKAVLVLRQGPFRKAVIRSSGQRTAVSLPFEDPRVAGWLCTRIHRAAHDAIRPARAVARKREGEV